MLSIAAGSLAFASGIRAMVGVLIPPIEHDLGHSRAQLSSVASVALLLYAFTQPMVGWAVQRFGSRRLILLGMLLNMVSGVGMMWASSLFTLHIFLGTIPILGFSAAGLIPATVLAAHWFGARQGMATGVVVAALPGGQALFGALAAALLPHLPWRESYLILTLAPALVLSLFSLFLLQDQPARSQAASAPAPAMPIRAVAATRDFWLIAIGYAVCGVTDQIMLVHLVAFLTDHGYSVARGSGIFSLLSLAGIVGSVLVGPLVDRYAARHILAFNYALRLMSYPFLFLFAVTNAEPYLISFAVLFGLTFMGNMPPASVFMRQAHGAASLGSIMGWLSLTHHLGGAAGVLAAGILYERLGGYNASFIGSLVLLAVAALASLALSKKPALPQAR